MAQVCLCSCAKISCTAQLATVDVNMVVLGPSKRNTKHTSLADMRGSRRFRQRGPTYTTFFFCFCCFFCWGGGGVVRGGPNTTIL